MKSKMMTNMKKKWMMIVWCCALLAGMAACADDDKVPSGDAGNEGDDNVESTFTGTTEDGAITGLPNDLSSRWGRGTTDVWDGTEDVSWYLGNQRSEYTITTAEQLAGLAALTKAGEDFAGITVKLAVNVILNERIEMDEDYHVLNAGELREWNPIEDFGGIFDGDCHVISGLYIDEEEENVALFRSRNSDCQIKNVGIVNSYIRGESAASVVMKGEGYVYNCFNTSVIVGENVYGIGYTGYVAFMGPGYSRGVVQHCFNKGVLVGETGENGTSVYGISDLNCQHCYNAGRVVIREPFDAERLNIYCLSGFFRSHNINITNSCYNLCAPEGNEPFRVVGISPDEVYYGDEEPNDEWWRYNCYSLYRGEGNADLTGVTGTFTDNGGVLAARPGAELPEGVTTLVDALNFDWQTGKPREKAIWTVDPRRNNGYPVFAE